MLPLDFLQNNWDEQEMLHIHNLNLASIQLTPVALRV